MMSRDQKFQHCVPTWPVFVLGDLTRPTQVFTNLMVNASKFTPNQEAVALTCVERGNDVVVSVHDNGIGIRKEDLNKIFDMFAQPGRGLNWKHGGIGIGLSLAKNLVQMHNGKISVRSKGSNLGSEFVVTLSVDRRAITADTTNAQCNAPPPMRILVVDDDLSVAKSSAILLKTLGHDVLVCDGGRKALSIAAQFRPHAVLCDIAMPEFTGYDYACQIRQESWGENIYLVAFSGYGATADVDRARCWLQFAFGETG